MIFLDIGVYETKDRTAQKIYAELIAKKMAAQESSIIKNMLKTNTFNNKANKTRVMTIVNILMTALFFLFYIKM